MNSVWRAAMFAMLLSVPGCTITEISRINTGICEGDLKKLSDAFQCLENKKEQGKITFADVQEIFGKDFHKAPNVERVPGPAAFRRIFQDAVFQSALADPRNAEKLLSEMQEYRAYFIPFRDITTYIDRYYFSTKETHKLGDDLMIMLLMRNGVLYYSDYRYVKIDSRDSTSAFGQGVIDVLKEFLGPTDALYDLINKLKDDIKKDKE